ncbi:hypothetical protein Agub_g3273 [Astrephomene gubernaculifera]|uniref:Methyltransferase domain-containing protein n=1 Tax=Astrephomene gubernaculifera TaxID=47775 RepID=A0AAD3DIV2_9CHLO|nr:hypothetical protein Agub_g3034 [Astrephomene gubernaculifera]GFR42400.1 hypothetical protein Agub_g3273 [Astrephomene gubernaculifera]
MAGNGCDRDRIWSFQKREYWDGRYKQRLDGNTDFNESTFDWLCTYDAVRDFIDRHIAGATFALDIGCGNADFAAAVCAAHPHMFITGIDYSPMLFDLCTSSIRPRGGWMLMDACALAFRAGSFDVVLDKGCLDALCAGYDQLAVLRGWGRDITEQEVALESAAVSKVAQLLREVDRCLAPGGRYICISYEGPAGRQRFFSGAAASPLSLELVESCVEEASHNYVYVFKKRRGVAARAAGRGVAC